MTNDISSKLKNRRGSNNEPVAQQFAASGSAVPAPALPTDAENAENCNLKPASKSGMK